MKRKTIVGAITVVIIIIFILVLKGGTGKPAEMSKNKQGKDKTAKKVEACIVKPTLLINEISVNGSLLAFDEVELRNEVAGRVISVYIPEGKFVRKGTLLVKLFDEDLWAELKKLESQLALQQEIANRQQQLLKVSGITQTDYDQTVLQLNSIKANIEVQKALIRKTEVHAPFDGVIGLRNISVGAIVTPSTLLTTIRTADKLKLDFFVPEKYGPEIRTGMNVNFTLYNQNEQYDATVIATEENIDNSTRNLKVRALVKSRSTELLSGAFTNVILRLSENQHALMVPTQAIIPQEMDKNVIVARDGKAHFTKVTTGIRKASNIEITEGIQAGDTVITTGIMFLTEGAPLSYSKILN